jgi:signal transduction histidine kinase
MPDPIIKLGLAEAISQYCFSMRKPSLLDINVQTYGDLDNADLSFRLTIYRMVQELLHNVIKHSHATIALVQVIKNNDIIGITVEDNGIGIANDTDHGMGLNNLQQRVQDLGGKISITTASNKGTSITIELPIKPTFN